MTSTYTDFNKENNKEGAKFTVGDHVTICKYKNIFTKGYIPNWSEYVFVIKRVKNIVLWTYVISDLSGEQIVGRFYIKQEKIRVEKVIKGKGNKLYVKWKDYDHSFNSWIYKKDIV